MKIIKTIFGEFAGKEVYCFTLSNKKGNAISIINYGATIISWQVKDKANNVRDIVAGFNDLESYLTNGVCMGCIVGRYANRIAYGKFKINNIEYQLACNNAPNHLHGGDKGFDKMMWEATIVDGAVPKLSLFYLSKDGEEGYPGNLSVTVEYSYTENDELIIEYFADTDKATHVNLTSHSYFNLTGDVGKNILSHWLQINADNYTAVNEHKIPTGELVAVESTAFDFKLAKKISQHINETGMGYDHNFVLNKDGTELAIAAILSDPEQELELTVYTTEPAMQLYTAHFLDGSLINRDGKQIGKSAGVCLETQHYPDAPNHPEFPSTLLLPQTAFTSKTIYKISLK